MIAQNDIYPSRTGSDGKFLDRVDPVDYTGNAADSPLAPEQVEAYLQDGYLVVGQLFDASEVGVLVSELDRLREEHAESSADTVIREPKSDVVRSIFRMHKSSAIFDRLVRDARLVDVARYLLGDDVYIHQSRLNYKPGFRGKEFYWHSDFETWHVEDGMPLMRALSVSVSLSDNLDANGPLMLVPGSHLKYVSCPGRTPEDHYKRSLRNQEYGVPPDDMLTELIDAGGITPVTGPAGTVTFFECNTMHGSNSNITPYPRSNAFIVYNSVSNRPTAPFGTRTPRPDFLAERDDFTPIQSVSGRISRAADDG